jgi:hypothetical protein
MTVTPMRPARASRQQQDQDLYEKIKAKMANPHGPSEIETIRPGTARLILDNLNSNNRPKKTLKIAQFAHDMETNNWAVTGDTIKFSTLYLRDGQNRLEACCKAGQSFTTHIVYGLDDRIFTLLDRGKPRTPADAFAIAGIPNPTTVAGAVRWLEKFRTGNLKDRGSLQQDEALKAYNEHYDATLLERSVEAARHVNNADGTPKTIAVALFYLFAKKNSTLASEFFEAWATRNWGGRMRPVKKASTHLATLHEASNGRIHELARIKAWIAAWNLVVSNRVGQASDFKWSGSDDTMPRIKGRRVED